MSCHTQRLWSDLSIVSQFEIVEIQISKESEIPLRQQISAQLEFQIATGKLKPGDTLPSVRALARQLRIHHNTVSQAYNDVTALYLLLRKHGSRLVVRSPEDRAGAAPTFPWPA